MNYIAILNRESGTFKTTDLDAYIRHVRAVMAAAGHQIALKIVSGAEVEDALKNATSGDHFDAILVGGGDGTVSAAAALAWKNGIRIGVIPAGTMNLFARSLGMPLDIWEAIETLASGEFQDNDIGSCNGRAFIHQFSAGLHARMVRLRNTFDYGSRLGKIAASARAAIATLLNPPSFRVNCVVDGETFERKVSAVSISANPFGSSPFLVPENMRSGQLGLYLADTLTNSMAAGLALDILRGRLRESPLVLDMYPTSVELSFPDHHKATRGVIDGELVPLPRELSVRIHKGELKVIAPSVKAEPL